MPDGRRNRIAGQGGHGNQDLKSRSRRKHDHVHDNASPDKDRRPAGGPAFVAAHRHFAPLGRRRRIGDLCAHSQQAGRKAGHLLRTVHVPFRPVGPRARFATSEAFTTPSGWQAYRPIQGFLRRRGTRTFVGRQEDPLRREEDSPGRLGSVGDERRWQLGAPDHSRYGRCLFAPLPPRRTHRLLIDSACGNDSRAESG